MITRLRYLAAALAAAIVLLHSPVPPERETTRPERPASVRLHAAKGEAIRLAITPFRFAADGGGKAEASLDEQGDNTAPAHAAGKAQASPYEERTKGDAGGAEVAGKARAVPDEKGAGAPNGADATAMVSTVLRQDLEFEGAFDVVAPEGTTALPVPRGPRDPALEAWRASGLADGLVCGTVRLDGDRITVDTWVFDVASGGVAFARGFTGPLASARLVAHTLADELHVAQADVRGVARSQFVFVSDRVGSHKDPTGVPRRYKEIYGADYDGTNDRRLTSDADLALFPSLSPDHQNVAYTSYRRGYQDLFIVRLAERRVDSPTAGRGKNWLPAWSPDGTKIAFTSNRDGNSDIWVMDADGSNQRRLTRHYGIDSTPAWSPDGKQIAFTSDRTGRPQIWVMDADGNNPRQLSDEKYCDRATWAPAPFHEIAFVSQTKTGFDIVVKDLETGERRQLTHGLGNESPSYAPNGRHIAFTSKRSGSEQIWVMTRTGERLRQVTRVGNNTMADWR